MDKICLVNMESEEEVRKTLDKLFESAKKSKDMKEIINLKFTIDEYIDIGYEVENYIDKYNNEFTRKS
jgi:hypothetical protein